MSQKNNYQITLTLWQGKHTELIACEPLDTTKECFGIAFDIGTTTIVGYLINLINGKIHSVSSLLNPQTAYGEDLITRIEYIRENENGLEVLNSAVIDALNKIINKNCLNAKIDPSHIYEACIVGNTVMHHIVLGINPKSIGVSPYIPVVQRSLNNKASGLGININQEGNIYTLPTIAGFIGADTMAVILSSDIYRLNKLTLVIDIGTNGEIVVGNKNDLYTGSCAAGSALEGAHIKDGMRAAAGAIDSVKIDPFDLSVSYTTIKDKQPVGICGSGLIDLIAEMLKSKIIKRNGNFNENFSNNKRLIKINESTAFIIAKKEETSHGKDILLSQDDIRQIQLAKAAFYSGMRIILKNLKGENTVEQVYLAGAFGNFINKNNAKFIGMIPDLPEADIYQIGNAAGIGAQYCLLNGQLRKKSEELLHKIQYVEIASNKDFQREFAEAMYFPHLNLDLFPSLSEYENISKR